MEDYKKLTIDAYDKDTSCFSEKFNSRIDLHRRYEFKQFVDLLNGDKILDL